MGNILRSLFYNVRHCGNSETQNLHRIQFKKGNPEVTPEIIYQYVYRQIDEIIIIPQDNLHTLAGEGELGGHMLDFSVIYSDAHNCDFDESLTQGPDTAFVLLSIFTIQATFKN